MMVGLLYERDRRGEGVQDTGYTSTHKYMLGQERKKRYDTISWMIPERKADMPLEVKKKGARDKNPLPPPSFDRIESNHAARRNAAG